MEKNKAGSRVGNAGVGFAILSRVVGKVTGRCLCREHRG